MTLRPLAMVLCAAVLAACGGGGGGGGGGGASPATPGSPEGPPPVRFAYVANTGDDTVSVLALDPATGVLRHQGYVHVGVGAWPRQVVLHPTRPLAFVVNQDAGAISSYALDDVSGAPTPIGSPVDTGGDPIAAAVHPSGQFVYAVTDEEVILAFRVDASGALEPLGTPLATGPGAASVVVHPSGRFAYTTNSSGNTLSAFAIDPSTGALASAGTFGTPSGNLAAMAIDPEGRLAAVTNGGAQSVTFFEIDQTTGALTEVTTILGPSRTSGVAIHPSGRFVYVGNPTTDAVAAFEVDLSAGTVSPIDADPVAPGVQGFPAGTEPLDLAVDPTGLALYVTDLNDWSITAYAIDPASGALTSLGTVRARPGTFSIAIAPQPSAPSRVFAYAANFDADTVSAYEVDAATGALHRIDADPGTTGIQDTPTGLLPLALAAHPSGRFLYVVNRNEGGSGRLGTYAIDARTGVLVPGPPADAGFGPVALAVDPWGRFLFAANRESDDVWTYAVDPATGRLDPVPGAPFAAGAGPTSIAFVTTGR